MNVIQFISKQQTTHQQLPSMPWMMSEGFGEWNTVHSLDVRSSQTISCGLSHLVTTFEGCRSGL